MCVASDGGLDDFPAHYGVTCNFPSPNAYFVVDRANYGVSRTSFWLFLPKFWFLCQKVNLFASCGV